MADFSKRERRMVKELKEKSKVMARLEAEVAGMKKNEALAHNRIIEELYTLKITKRK